MENDRRKLERIRIELPVVLTRDEVIEQHHIELRAPGETRNLSMGGAFMHARVGLQTPYLSKQWFDCIGACVEEAKKIGMEAWLYDEDRWPSGAAGGLVTKHVPYRARHLVLTIARDKKKISVTNH